MIIKLNERFRAIFLKFLKEKEKENTYYSSYNSYSSYYSNNYRKYIYFYEWSNMDKGSKSFHSIKEFYEFLASSHIVCTDAQKLIIEHNEWSYATCVPGKNILLVENQYYLLKNKLESFRYNHCTSLVPSYS